MPDVVCADLLKIRNLRQQDQSSNRCVKSDQKGSESSSSSRTSSGIILLTSSLSGKNSMLSKIWLLSCWECGFELSKGHEWPSILRVVCCLLEMSLHWSDHLSREILPSVVCLTQCDLEASAMRGPWPTRGCHDMKRRNCKKNHAIGRMLLLLHVVTLTEEQNIRKQRVYLIYWAETAAICNPSEVMRTTFGNSVVVRCKLYTILLEEVMCPTTVHNMLIDTSS